MYQTPTIADFNRKLTDIIEHARENVSVDEQRIQVEHAAKGLGQSGPLIGALATRWDELHAEAVDAAMRLIQDFVDRTHLSPRDFCVSTRSSLERLGAELAAYIRAPVASLQQGATQFRVRYERKFQNRIDGALRDIEIGFIGGQNVAPFAKDSDLRGLVLQRFYDARRQPGWLDMPVGEGLDRDTSFSICTQLAEHGLIHWRPIEGHAGFERVGFGKITASGVDVIEETSRPPIAITIHGHVISASANVQIGDRNMQGVTISGEKISVSIDHANATPEEKAEAKSLFAKVLENPILAAIIKGFVGS
jgi:hypothetical protein